MTQASIGAIRFDEWYNPTSLIANALSDADLQQYAPAHLTVTNSYTVKIPTTITQAMIDAEIAAAAANGIGYWVYFFYNLYGVTTIPPEGAPWSLHQSCSNKNAMPWAAMIQPAMCGSTGNYAAQVALIVTYFQQANYYKLASGKPLLYLDWSSSNLTDYWGGSLSNFASFVAALRAATVAAGIPTPYIVVMNGLDATVRSGIGADAISAYNAAIPVGISQPYPTLDTATQAYWTQQAALGAPIVPVAMSGWNRTGRIRRPQVWEDATQRPYFGLQQAIGRPTAAQLKAHIASVRAYVAANPGACPANTVLLYAWNECDEGHPICPTIGVSSGMALV